MAQQVICVLPKREDPSSNPQQPSLKPCAGGWGTERQADPSGPLDNQYSQSSDLQIQ